MEDKKLMFNDEVNEKIGGYNVMNIILLLVTLAGGAFIANDMATVATNYSWTSFDNMIFITTLATFAVPAILLYVVLRLLIGIYGEKVRGNHLKQTMLDNMNNK